MDARRSASQGQPTGEWWIRLPPSEKELWLEGFLAGAGIDSTALRPAERFRFAPTVYAAQLDDFYWWSNHRSTPVVDALRTINQEIATH